MSYLINKLGNTPTKSKHDWAIARVVEKFVDFAGVVNHIPNVAIRINNLVKISTKKNAKIVVKSSIEKDVDFLSRVDSLSFSKADSTSEKLQKFISVATSPFGFYK